MLGGETYQGRQIEIYGRIQLNIRNHVLIIYFSIQFDNILCSNIQQKHKYMRRTAIDKLRTKIVVYLKY